GSSQCAVSEPLEQLIDQAKRLFLILVYRSIEIDSRADDHLFWSPPILPGAKRTGQMETVVAPAGAEVSRDGSLRVLGAVLTPKRSVERMQQEIDDQRISSRLWI